MKCALKSNDSGQGNAVHCLCTVHADGPPKTRDSKIVSPSLVKKRRRRLVLFWSAMNRMHALALAGWPTGFVQSIDQKNSFFISFSSFGFRWM
jgi:hypothetical protein